jgi:aryl-alcohol dehydrogenase-like predicted oxidoreductase
VEVSAQETTRLGGLGPAVSRLGLGCWAFGGHGWGRVDDSESIEAIRFALDAGCNLYDTADVYGFGHSETLLRRALGGKRRSVVIATKGGVRWEPSGRTWRETSGSYLRHAVEASLQRLSLESIPLYYVHWPDQRTPIEETIAALCDLQKEGKVLSIGVSNFNEAQLGEALTCARVAAVQVQYSLFERSAASAVESLCRAHDITMVGWGSLADGLLTGKFRAELRRSRTTTS